MKAIKWIAVTCLISIGVGITGAGVTLGQMYKNSQMSYQVKEQKEIEVTQLKKLYISSDVPVRIIPTEEKAYVTFDASGNGIIFPEPKYDLQVTSEGTSSYINLKQLQESQMYLFSNNPKEELVVYLPAKALDTLEVKINEKNYYRDNAFTFSSNSSINNLKIDAQTVDLALSGSYNNIDISASRGSIDIYSNTPAQVKLNQGGATAVLSGQIATVDIANGHNLDNSETVIKTSLEAKVAIQKSYGKVQIEGKLSELKVDGSSYEVEANSSTPYNVTISNDQNTDITLKGMLQNATIEGNEGGKIKLYPTGTPKRVEILGEDLDVYTVLPKDISGFEIKKSMEQEDFIYEKDYDDYKENNNLDQDEWMYTEDIKEEHKMIIDFQVKSENLSNGMKRIYYGDEAMKMFIGVTDGDVYITK